MTPRTQEGTRIGLIDPASFWESISIKVLAVAICTASIAVFAQSTITTKAPVNDRENIRVVNEPGVQLAPDAELPPLQDSANHVPLPKPFPTAIRSYDGSGNNPANPRWGSAGVRLVRLAPVAYSDGISSLAGVNRPSAREISNVISDQGDNDVISDRMLSAMVYAWGQFIDHDLDLTPTGGTELMAIPVPEGDPSFDPDSTGDQVIMTSRSVFDPTTGTGPTNPREQVNVISSWLDGSMIYGSDAVTAKKLRTLRGGRLQTSPGDLLPLNNAQYFPTGALPMANDSHLVPNDQLFAAGDVRANENIELTSLHTVFLREHNQQADRIAQSNSTLTDEQIYQKARAIVIAEIQAITYNEWIPAVLGPSALPRYPGYKSNVNGSVSTEFSTAAFRFGHSLLGNDVEFLDDNGNSIRDEVELSEAFFNPPLFAEAGPDPILKYLMSDPASELDTMVVNSVRNFLFGPPGAGGLDLASLNIQRGRDHGLSDYNTTREYYALPTVSTFAGITSNVDLQSRLQAVYGNVDNIDLWVGGLAEDHVPGASVGPTLRKIIADQFRRTRDGDRFWYQLMFSGQALQQIQATTLACVIRRNTDLTNIQNRAFYFVVGVSGVAFVDTVGNGQLGSTSPRVANRGVQLVGGDENEVIDTERTDSHGDYQFGVLDGLRTGQYYVQILSPDDSHPIAFSKRFSITRGDQMVGRVNIPLKPRT